MEQYERLHPKVQKWVYKQGWPALREIQDKAIPHIMAGGRDVLISASTAAGKTEAFFLPALSAIADANADNMGFGILYISPLKALINDQFRRLEELCEELELPLTPWHGDSSQTRKKRAKKEPSGVLLITPESLESLLVRDSGWVSAAFSSISYIVIDEFHAFIGTERGMHLLSLMNRLEHLTDRHDEPIPRVALSATLGELELVPVQLRPNQTLPCEIITSSHSHSSLKVQVKGYVDPVNTDIEEDSDNPAEMVICQELYDICRGDSHLVFANSRQRTEKIATYLSELCEKAYVPNEFFPHHGSLSKEFRETLEKRLQTSQLPTTAVCTMTLELGIDIGKVNSVAQVTAPHSVSSLRQRLGRSGRRGNASVLRMFIAEKELSNQANVIDKLRLELVQSLAIVRLLIESKWFEPADTNQYHFSTLLHQVLATTAQWGGVRADQLYALLCHTGPFSIVSVAQFKALLIHMASLDLLIQIASGEIVLGANGEKLVNHYSFYAVFSTPEEYRLINGSRTLGTMPIDNVIVPGQHLVFAGRRWKITEVNIDQKVIYLEQAKGGKPPKFGGSGLGIHDRIRNEMFNILEQGDHRISVGHNKVEYIDETAQNLMHEASSYFDNANLDDKSILQSGNNVLLFPWMGDKIVNTLVSLLRISGFEASAYAGVIEIEKADTKSVAIQLNRYVSEELPSNAELASFVPEKCIEKYDEYLPETLLNYGFGQRMFDTEQTRVWLADNLHRLQH